MKCFGGPKIFDRQFRGTNLQSSCLILQYFLKALHLQKSPVIAMLEKWFPFLYVRGWLASLPSIKSKPMLGVNKPSDAIRGLKSEGLSQTAGFKKTFACSAFGCMLSFACSTFCMSRIIIGINISTLYRFRMRSVFWQLKLFYTAHSAPICCEQTR